MVIKYEEGLLFFKRNWGDEYNKSNLSREIDERIFMYLLDLVFFSIVRFGIF